MFDTMMDKISSVSSTAKSWANDIVGVGSSWYKEAETYVTTNYNDGKAAVEDKIAEAQWEAFNLATKKAEVDALLQNMIDGPEKEALLKKQSESRSFFSSNVAPLINKVLDEKEAFDKIDFNQANKYSNFAGVVDNQGAGNHGRMGFLPVVPVAAGAAVVAASAALIYWCKKAYALEEAIANDPNLTAMQKAQLISQTGIQGAIKSASFLGVLALVGGVAYLMMDKK